MKYGLQSTLLRQTPRSTDGEHPAPNIRCTRPMLWCYDEVWLGGRAVVARKAVLGEVDGDVSVSTFCERLQRDTCVAVRPKSGIGRLSTSQQTGAGQDGTSVCETV